ncbi:GntR family transcriptional regulator [Spirosoma utsteinense]|uniref:DNA-binding transcriptional regulator YhcF (GntR family) n=1 Tax=Spirosoma utsteinense TaxID=2585773 RepID=A0ABR6WC35_9BACT|nr:GntR family transcriptional regulator [Spirosoma utsteinense]MBC3784002.1 DNA-binding transcriptional regulator YhcF (GntR family) [Spirosoma utsteinense]MBC3793510.1 DNA-binding transcriptional regulator YhcF (GntR family) [Spirosoma utsteinense]
MDFRDKQAIYLQIAEYVSEQILLGRWTAGDRIPSVRELAAELEVNPNTVMRTYEFLSQQGVIANKRGIGYFPADEALDKIRAFRREQFLQNDLPQFFKNLTLLGIDLNEIQTRYDDYVNANTHIR